MIKKLSGTKLFAASMAFIMVFSVSSSGVASAGLLDSLFPPQQSPAPSSGNLLGSLFPPPQPAPTPAPTPVVITAPKVPLGAAVWSKYMEGGSEYDPNYTPAFLNNFDSLTPENEMKMFILQPQKGVYDFSASDKLVNMAQANGKRVRGHTLIYEQNPAWVTQPLLWTKDGLLAVMKDHITTVMTHYKGKVAEWDVVNEAFDDNGNYKNNIWYKWIGPDYIKYAYMYAQQADPNAKLYYNEYSADRPNAKTTAIVNLVKSLRSQGVQVHGIGLEMHIGIGGNYPSHTELQQLMKTYADLGLEVEFTELDVGVGAQSLPVSQAVLDEQKAVYQSVVSDCQQASNCQGVTIWGVTDKYSWRGVLQAATLIDNNYQKKAAYTTVRDILIQR